MIKESIKRDMKNVNKLNELLSLLNSLYENKEKLSSELELLNDTDLHIGLTHNSSHLMFFDICKLVPKENQHKTFIPSSNIPSPEPETELKQILTNIPVELSRDFENMLLQHIKDNYKDKLDEIDYKISITDSEIIDLKNKL